MTQRSGCGVPVVEFPCGCAYTRRGRVVLVAARCVRHTNIFHVMAMLPLFERIAARLQLAVNPVALWTVDRFVDALGFLHAARPYGGVVDDHELLFGR